MSPEILYLFSNTKLFKELSALRTAAPRLCYHPDVSEFEDFHYQDGELQCESVPLTKVAQEFGTPTYVYSRKTILDNYHELENKFSAVDPLICYSLKANANLSILGLLQKAGSGFDVVSGGELFRLKQIGADPKKIVFSGVGKTATEMELALDWDIYSINIESQEELDVLTQVSRRKGQKARIAFRINPDVDAKTHPYIATGLNQHKFGVDTQQINSMLEAIRRNPNLQLVGLGFHIGSQILDVQPFLDAFTKLKGWADRIRKQGVPIEHLDLGGGLGISYQGEPAPNLKQYAQVLAQKRRDYRIVMEPGRFVVGNAGILLTRILYRKTNQGKSFLVVDAAMNDLLRPSLYDAHHQILSVYKDRPWTTADVVGPVCETGDFFARNRQVPDAMPGDLLAIMSTGAYGFCLASNYNSRGRSAEILVNGNSWQEIRARESFKDLVRGEILPKT